MFTRPWVGGTDLNYFQKKWPKRCFDVGIAEQHAITFVVELATEGLKPFCSIYSSFLQRGYDQVIHDVDPQKLPVRFAIDRAGMVGADGPTHSPFDITYMAFEEGSIGGFGSHVSHYLTLAGLLDGPLKLRAMMLPDRYIDHGSPKEHLLFK
ncbi:hypothetical protein K1719_003779 [Acacia pycnantha]|nr:hypothetical protein K1719_003779 [Acacia pycnantha]